MWFTGRLIEVATVLVLDPSQVTGVPDEPEEPDVLGAFDAEALDPVEDFPPEEPVEPVDPVEPVEPAEPVEPVDAAVGEGLVEVVAAAPSSWAPDPSLHAVRESAARTVVAAAAARRVRGVRTLDM
nr:hypothetical protein [Streptomyces sp. NBC_00663]